MPDIYGMPLAYAACSEHASRALDYLSGLTVTIRKPGNEHEVKYRCICKKPADWFLLEIIEGEKNNG
jgi:hypothetical protein